MSWKFQANIVNPLFEVATTDFGIALHSLNTLLDQASHTIDACRSILIMQ